MVLPLYSYLDISIVSFDMQSLNPSGPFSQLALAGIRLTLWRVTGCKSPAIDRIGFAEAEGSLGRSSQRH
jgi:hypothetical protein